MLLVTEVKSSFLQLGIWNSMLLFFSPCALVQRLLSDTYDWDFVIMSELSISANTELYCCLISKQRFFQSRYKYLHSCEHSISLKL